MLAPRPVGGGCGHGGEHLRRTGTGDRENGTGFDRDEIGLVVIVLAHGYEGGEPRKAFTGANESTKVGRGGQSPGPSVLCNLEGTRGDTCRFG